MPILGGDVAAAELSHKRSAYELFLQRLQEFRDFDPKLVSDAITVADQLDQLVQSRETDAEERARLVERREALAHLLQTRLSLIKQAACFVFRRRPDIVREMADYHHRRERALRHRASLVTRRRRRQPTEWRVVHNPTG